MKLPAIGSSIIFFLISTYFFNNLLYSMERIDDAVDYVAKTFSLAPKNCSDTARELMPLCALLLQKSIFLKEEEKKRIKSWDNVVTTMTQLKTVSFCNKGLTEQPFGLHRLTNLTRLGLIGNQLKTISADLWYLKKLELLNLAGNFLTTLPEGIGNLKELVILGLEHNLFPDLPASIGDLPKIQWITANNNQITSIPNKFYKATSLHGINLANNKLKEIIGGVKTITIKKKNQKKIWGLAKLKKLRELILINNELQDIPVNTILSLKELKKLELGGNNIPADTFELLLRRMVQMDIIRSQEL